MLNNTTLNSDELPLISATIAITLAKNMTADELNFYGNLFTAIAAEMLVIAAARASEENNADLSVK